MQKKQSEYAHLLMEVGLNVAKGQTVVISSPVECAPFARLCATAAYDAGCREVILNWNDDALTREKFLRADDTVFDTVPAWRTAFYEDYSKEGAAFLSLYATDPENLKGVSSDRLTRSEVAAGRSMAGFRERQMKNEIPWCIASIPTAAWAKKVFPEVPHAEAALWDAILRTVRVSGDGRAVSRWHKHIDILARRKAVLTQYQFEKLHYQNSLGTDLWVSLPSHHIWEAGAETAANGRLFCANMPTEEVFTAPRRDGVNGVVVSSRPLSENGNLIDHFRLTIKDGKIIGVQAEIGEEQLRRAIAVDEGASYLGEVALVPCDSPIAQENRLFYNTLFDENASCHFAFGDAYPCVKGGAQMTEAERAVAGLNHSITHVDFMIGTPDLTVTGYTADGTAVSVLTNGTFAF